MMSLDEAIMYCRSKADDLSPDGFKHKQLENVLREAKTIRDFSNYLVDRVTALEKIANAKNQNS